MTQEEKAKAYDEALERAKTLYENANGMILKKWVEQVFPELKESEDEKVSKELIDAVQGLWDNDALPIPLSVKRKDEWLAWLEKQGEPSDEEMKTLLRTEYEKGRADVIAEMQKDWSEEDEIYYKRVQLSIEWARAHNRISEGSCDEQLNWLKSLKGRVQPQPKQEWSEEDKNFLYDTLSNLTELKDRYGEGYGNVGRCIDWLKSLRPQNRWRPSDEQIKVCKEVYADILSAKGFDLGTVVSELNRLEEGLKKKGE